MYVNELDKPRLTQRSQFKLIKQVQSVVQKIVFDFVWLAWHYCTLSPRSYTGITVSEIDSHQRYRMFQDQIRAKFFFFFNFLSQLL